MEIINKYKALDGKIFETQEECEKYDRLVLRVRQTMQLFCNLPKDENCRFANGKGYLQHKKEDVITARKEIVELGNEYFNQKDKWSFGAIGRLFNDAECNILYAAWQRLSNCDNKYREWGQGYYAVNPNKGIQEPYTE